MHHTYRFYSGRRKATLRLYMFLGWWTKIPLLGRLVRWMANAYGRNMHGAYLLTPAEAQELLDIAGGVAVGPCTCRQAYHNCNNPVEVEIMLGPTHHTLMEAMPHDYHQITGEEARNILQACHERGLIFTILKCRGDFYAICSCCSCCCVPLRLNKQYGIGDVLVRHKDIVREFREYMLAYRTGEDA